MLAHWQICRKNLIAGCAAHARNDHGARELQALRIMNVRCWTCENIFLRDKCRVSAIQFEAPQVILLIETIPLQIEEFFMPERVSTNQPSERYHICASAHPLA